MAKTRPTLGTILTLALLAVGAGVLARRAPGGAQQVEEAGPGALTDLAERDREKMQGTWQVVFVLATGRKPSWGGTKGLRLLISDNVITFKVADRTLGKTSFRLAPTKEPKWIDLAKKIDQNAPGIYALRGDDLLICYDETGTERPSGFSSEPSPPNKVLMKLKRVP